MCDTDDCFAVSLVVETGDDEGARSASEVPAAGDDLPRLRGRPAARA
ncbi:hypothetical protein QF034_008129 [Streptomyces africanus]|uniref:Uncharacterized protein n=1 Tax=Streptomyces africanus TaxID=231024 RepID=A0ABU0R2L9_9ACTN|nr:hypothetical protein [Streptomyces africanus]MDQ0753898.1 hypothetical protein [Streptomyces africanus]